MKAICIERVSAWVGSELIEIEIGDIVEYSAENFKFLVRGVKFVPTAFFAHFKVTEGDDRIGYSDFKYILCNYIFKNAVLYPNEYNGVRHLDIQEWDYSIMITVNKEENDIRISYPDKQEHYESYEDALEGIRSFVVGEHKQESTEGMAKRLLGVEDEAEGVGLTESYAPEVDLTLEELVSVVEGWKENSPTVSCDIIIDLLRSRKKGPQPVETELACGYCDSAKVNPELSDDNDYSAMCIGKCYDGYRLMLCSGWGRPTRIEVEKWDNDEWRRIGEYLPKYCPECGREIFEYNQSKSTAFKALSSVERRLESY